MPLGTVRLLPRHSKLVPRNSGTLFRHPGPLQRPATVFQRHATLLFGPATVLSGPAAVLPGPATVFPGPAAVLLGHATVVKRTGLARRAAAPPARPGALRRPRPRPAGGTVPSFHDDPADKARRSARAAFRFDETPCPCLNPAHEKEAKPPLPRSQPISNSTDNCRLTPL